jgi:hypothetical protein
MPPFPIQPSAPVPSSSLPVSPSASGSIHTEDSGSTHQNATSFTSILKSFGRGVVKASSSVHPTVPSEYESGNVRSRATGSSSRHAGVRPSRHVSGPLPQSSSAREAELEHEIIRRANEAKEANVLVGGPGRGGFASRLHAPIASSSKASPSVTTTTTTGHASPPPTKEALLKSPPVAPVASTSTSRSPATIQSRRRSLEAIPAMSLSLQSPTMPPLDIGPIPPPSKILPRLTALPKLSIGVEPLLPLIRLLASSVALYPFPPPVLAAASLSEALGQHSASPQTQSSQPSRRGGLAPSPTPIEIYLSQAHLLEKDADRETRAVLLELMLACVEASLGSTGGIKESEKAVYWEEARRWAEEGKLDVVNEEGSTQTKLPDADREGVVAVLSSLTRGGRDLSDVPGLVSLLCSFVTDALPSPAPSSPLFDPDLLTPFLRRPPAPAPYSSSLALLVSLHKFSSPHIYSTSTLSALRCTLEVARSENERDLGGQTDTGVLALLGAVVRFGEVTTGGALRQFGKSSAESFGGIGETEGDEILREVIAVVARMIGCEGLVGAIEVQADVKRLPQLHDEKIRPSILPPLALELMRDLLRSPAHQALKSLRNSLVGPPLDSVTPSAPPILLLVGTLRSLRNALLEHAADTEASAQREASSVLIGETRWPSMLSLGLPFLYSGLKRVMQWRSEYIDAEVLGLVCERIEASRRVGLRAKEGTTVKEGETHDGGVSYEEWDMAIEILSRAKHHIATWEEKRKRHWVLEG